MFCHSCGNQIPDQSKFCPFCGAEITVRAVAPGAQPEAAPAPQPEEVQQTYEAPAQQTFEEPKQDATQQTFVAPQPEGTQAPPVQGGGAVTQPKKKFPVWAIIVGGVVLAAIIAVVLILVLGGKSKTIEEMNKNYASIGSEWKLENGQFVYHLDIDQVGYEYTQRDLQYDYDYYSTEASYYAGIYNEKYESVKIIAFDSQGTAMEIDDGFITFVRDDYKLHETLDALNSYFSQDFVEWTQEEDYYVCKIYLANSGWSIYTEDSVLSDYDYVRDLAEQYANDYGEPVLNTRLEAYDDLGLAIMAEDGIITYKRTDYEDLWGGHASDEPATEAPTTTPETTTASSYKTEDGATVEVGKTYYANARGGLMLRDGAGTSYKATYRIEKGTELVALEVKDNWMRVDINGHSGWCCTDYVVADKKNVN